MVPSFNKDDCSELFMLVILEFILHMNNILLACVFSRLEALRFKAAFGRALWLGLCRLLEARGLGWLDVLYGKRSLLPLLDGEAGAPESTFFHAIRNARSCYFYIDDFCIWNGSEKFLSTSWLFCHNNSWTSIDDGINL